MVSVIIPVYNVEEYLEMCVNSVTSQTYKNLDIILVDDGSTDTSGELCDKLSQTDNRIRVIHKNNGGLSSARNAGIEIAIGEYLTFVDSDDIISPDFIISLLETIRYYKADIASCGIYLFPESNVNNKHPFMPTISGVLTNNEYVEKVLSHKIDNAVWNKLYSTKIIGKDQFKEGIINEDFPFIMNLMTKVKNIAFTNKRLYYYRKRDGSITRKLHPRSTDYVNNAIWFKKTIAFQLKLKNKKIIDSYIYQERIGLIGTLTKYGNPKEFRTVYNENITILKKNICKILFDHNIHIKQRIKLLIIIYFPAILKNGKKRI